MLKWRLVSKGTDAKECAPVAETSQASITPSHAKNDVEKDIFILKQLVTKDFKLKYRRSVLGVVWSVLNPLLMMVVMAIVFSTMFAAMRGGNIPNYPLYLILGNITFAFMSESTNAAMSSIIDAAPLLKKVKVHRFVFPVQKALFALVNFAFSLIAVALVMLWFRIVPTWHLIWLPVFLALLVVFCTGLGLLLSALSVFFRDVMHLWGVIITAWTYLTPIFWNISMIEDMPRAVQFIMHANPMFHFLGFIRSIALYQTNPEPITVAMCAGWALVAAVAGYAVFHKTEHEFILYV